MSSYIFELNNYHAVKNARIKIDGITVLAGLNGSGKSTVSRWLHHVVYTLNQYDSMVEKSGIQDVSRFLSKMERTLLAIVSFAKSREFNALAETVSESRVSSVSQTGEYYNSACDFFLSAIEEHFRDNPETRDFQRIERFFHVERDENDSLPLFLDKLHKQLDSEYLKIVDEVSRQKEMHTSDTFADKIYSVIDPEIEDSQINFGLLEDGVELLGDDEFKVPLMLRNVIYIDTHKIGQALNLWPKSELAKMLGTPVQDRVDDKARIIARMIQHQIGGNVEVAHEPQQFSGKFRFVSKNGNSFNLKGAATGIISFSYLLQLLQNGWINEDTLLIIDEPESHLHPQWVVEYARVLVMIHKLIGTKVVVSSHNPDMVSAIETIARNENLDDVTRFYLSEKSEDAGEQYTFRDLGFDITEIFDSFNIAIDRIAFYGKPDN